MWLRSSINCTNGRRGILLFFALAAVAIASGWYLSSHQRSQARFEVAWEALTTGDFATATVNAEQLRKEPEFNNHAKLIRAGVLIRGGDAIGGLRELEHLTREESLEERKLLLTCEALHRLKRWPEAVAVANQILNLPSHGSEAHRWLAVIYFDLGSMSQSEDHLLRLTKMEPQDYSPFHLLGQIHLDFERYREAIEDFRCALNRNPPAGVLSELHLGLAKGLMKQNDYHNAMLALKHVSLDDNMEAQGLRAECLWSIGRKSESKDALAVLLTRYPDSPEILWPAARIAQFDEQLTEATRLFLKIVEISPSDHQALLALSSLYRRHGELRLAEEFFTRRNAALELFERMVSLNKLAIQQPSNAVVRDELSDICRQLGKNDLAIVWKEAAVSLRLVSQ